MVKKLFYLLVLAMGFTCSINAQDASFYKKYAEKGDKEAMVNLAQCYMNGTGGVNQDYNQATEWLAKAAKKKHAPALHQLGLCYLYGAGVLKDFSRGWELIQKAVKKSYPAAFYTTACCYRDGIYVTQDYRQWYSWLMKAAEMGDDDAQSDLGRAFLYGVQQINVQQDYNQAVSWLKKAAEQNNANGLFYLGVCYKFGAGVEADESKAFPYIYQAAQLGNADAQCEVADAYMRGTGGLQTDYSEASKYLLVLII